MLSGIQDESRGCCLTQFTLTYSQSTPPHSLRQSFVLHFLCSPLPVFFIFFVLRHLRDLTSESAASLLSSNSFASSSSTSSRSPDSRNPHFEVTVSATIMWIHPRYQKYLPLAPAKLEALPPGKLSSLPSTTCL